MRFTLRMMMSFVLLGIFLVAGCGSTSTLSSSPSSLAPSSGSVIQPTTPSSPAATTSIQPAVSSSENTSGWTTFVVNNGAPLSNVTTSVIQDAQGTIWVGTTQGLWRFNGTKMEVYNDVLSDTPITSAARDNQGDLWFGTSMNGTFEYTGKEWRDFTPGNANNGLPGAAIRDILVDRQGNIWFATVGNVGQRTAPVFHGVTRYDGKTWTTYLDHTDVETMFQDSDGNLWFGTNVGVIRYDGSHWQTFTTKDGLADNYVVAIAEDGQGNIWFGTWNGGVSRYDGKEWKTYSAKDGLETNAVHCMLKDSRGNMWFGSYSIDGYYGISLFNGTRWQHFDPWPGRESKYHYNVISIFEDATGNIWFATSIGLVRYSPR